MFFLNIRHITFNEFGLIIENLLNQVEALCITPENDSTYLDRNRWKQWILFHMHHLQIFDIMISYSLDLNEDIFE